MDKAKKATAVRDCTVTETRPHATIQVNSNASVMRVPEVIEIMSDSDNDELLEN